MRAKTTLNREAWLHAVAARLENSFATLGSPLPRLRISCGFPSVRAIASSKRRIGECWMTEASSDGAHEILISPTIADPVTVAGTLTHELVHAAVGSPGHKAPFRKLALALGLEGKMTETTEGEAFKRLIAPILKQVGPYPHAVLNASHNRKVQSTRLIKCQCLACGYTVRITRMWLADVGAPHCPMHGEMVIL